MYKILHLEDEVEFYYLLKNFLSDESYQLFFAPDVEQAIDLTKFLDFDLIISDIHLNRGTTAPYIKFLGDNKFKIPIIIYSSSSPDKLGECLSGVDLISYFSKNKMEDLCLKINKFFSDKKGFVTRKAI